MAEITPQPTSIQSLYGQYVDGKLFVNRRYQRKLVWTLEEKRRLIESLSKKYPIPAILIAEREGQAGEYEIIDGLQRLQAIVSFIEGAFATVDDKLFNLEFFTTAKSRFEEGKFSQIDIPGRISQKDVSTLLDYSLAFSVMRNASDAEIDDVFDRINTYGHRLSDQERRQAGVQNAFSGLVRKLASTIRGDASPDVLPLSEMASISVDLPTTKHGYFVKAHEVFWVDEGILRSTDLRDSMDEQCVADIAASIVLGEMVDRSKDYLDNVYDRQSDVSGKVLAALDVYGVDQVSDEIKFCIDEIRKVCSAGKKEKLRDIVFQQRNTNGFPTVFTVILMAFHRLYITKKMRIADYASVKDALNNIEKRINSGRSATTPKERVKNVDIVVALLESRFVPGDLAKVIYSNHTTADIEVLIRRSEIELADYELKQGVVSLGSDRHFDEDAFDKIMATMTAIANNGRDRIGKILLGVTDKDSDALRVKELDGVDARGIGRRKIVGVAREAPVLGKTVEQYYNFLREKIRHSLISEPLKSDVLSNMDYNSFYGMGVVVITIPSQKELSFYGDDVFWREGDSTRQATTQKQVAGLVKRF